MIYTKTDRFLTAGFLLIMMLVMFSIETIQYQSFVFIDSFSFSLGVLTSIFFIFRNYKIADISFKDPKQIVLVMTYPFLFSAIFGMIMCYNFYNDLAMTYILIFGGCSLFASLLLLLLLIFRKDTANVKRIIFIIALYLSAVINRVLTYVASGVPDNIVFIELTSFVSTCLFTMYMFFLSKHSIMFVTKSNLNQLKNK